MADSDHEEEEDTGPSVDSTDPEERIKARRIRIQKRVQAKRRATIVFQKLSLKTKMPQMMQRLFSIGLRMEMGQVEKKKDPKEEMTKSRKQMEDSRLRLTKLRSDGTEMVSNIRVAGDSRETQRRAEEEELLKQRKERLDQEAKSGAERFDEITRKWETALQKEIPQDLHEMLMQQKNSCDNMIYEKNKLITDFQTELKDKDDRYVKDLKKQAEDIDLMIERMDEQVKHLTKAYREELEQIEKAFITERTDMRDAHMKKWEATMQARRDKEVDFMKQREKRVEDYEKQLQHLRVQDAEEYNMVKIKLETDVQILQQQLQQMKATYQLNQEKLEYNFQVLRKRDEENTITKSQQKRKITRLQDILTNLKNKLRKQEKTYRDENVQLTEEYKRITEQFKELQKKSKHFMATDAKQFNDVWRMNEEEAKKLVNKILEQDRIFHEVQMGIPWEAPDVKFMDNSGPILSDAAKKSGVSAHQIAKEALSGELEESDDETESSLGERRSQLFQRFKPKLIKNILEMLCDEGGFLIESKLTTLLAPLEKDERSLIKLDAIFAALGVDTEDDIHLLVNYFATAVDLSNVSSDSMTRMPSLPHPPTMPGVPGVTDPLLKEQASADGLESQDSGVLAAGFSKFDVIHANEALKALRQFVEDNKNMNKEKVKSSQFKLAALEERDDADDEKYWQLYSGIIGGDRDKIWGALREGLEKYFEVCQGRSKLIDETEGLRQQNAELRMLLHQYVNSKVNQELEIPPTRVLQLELNPQQ